MTLDEAVALPPCREKDAIVAEVVMGWTYRRDYLVFDDVTYSWLSSSGKPMNPEGLTTTGDGMLLVMLRVEEAQNVAWQINAHDSPRREVIAWGADEVVVGEGTGETLPDAVANAALNAMWKAE